MQPCLHYQKEISNFFQVPLTVWARELIIQRDDVTIVSSIQLLRIR